jgi:hypothetical protein
VISTEEARHLLETMDVSNVVRLRDRALIAAMAYRFELVSALVGLKVEDYYPQQKRWWLRLHEKNGKVNEMSCHHKLEGYLHRRRRGRHRRRVYMLERVAQDRRCGSGPHGGDTRECRTSASADASLQFTAVSGYG